MMYFRIFSLLAAILLAGCGAIPSAEHLSMKSRPDRSLLYVFRPRLDSTGILNSPEIRVDGTTVAKLGREEFTILELTPGRHRLLLMDTKTSSPWNTEADVILEEGQTFFIAIWNQAQMTNSGNAIPIRLPNGVFIPITYGVQFSTGKVTLEPVEEALGREAILSLRIVEASAFRPSSKAEPDQLRNQR